MREKRTGLVGEDEVATLARSVDGLLDRIVADEAGLDVDDREALALDREERDGLLAAFMARPLHTLAAREEGRGAGAGAAAHGRQDQRRGPLRRVGGAHHLPLLLRLYPQLEGIGVDGDKGFGYVPLQFGRELGQELGIVTPILQDRDHP